MLNRFALAACVALSTGCASQWHVSSEAPPRLAVQNKLLAPGNGGEAVDGSALQAGDILLSSAHGLNSAGVRLITLSPVSHAALYLGDNQVVEAVGQGIRVRTLDAMLAEEATVVAFRDPRVGADHVSRMHAFAQGQVGRKYDFVGILLQAPFTVERRLCEVPVMPAVLRDLCIRGVGAIQLGVVRNDRFFCSQFVLETYRQAGVPLTDADPRLLHPGDLLHMREGDVPSVRTHQALQYVGHLKLAPGVQAAAASD